MLVNVCINFIYSFKNLYGRFWRSPDGFKEYYLKLDTYYYNHKKEMFFVVIRVRNKRTVDKVPINDILGDKDYIQELHPVDACFIGIFANGVRNGLIDKNDSGEHEIKRFRECACFVKCESILAVARKYFSNDGTEITVLSSKCLEREIEIPTKELCKNQALLYALDAFQTLSIGYDASESFARSIRKL